MFKFYYGGMTRMFKAIFIILVSIIPFQAMAEGKTCSEYDRIVGEKISNLFTSMYRVHLEGRMNYKTYDEIKTEIHYVYNTYFQKAFKQVSRDTPNKCEQIGNEAIVWIETYPGMINDRLSKGK